MNMNMRPTRKVLNVAFKQCQRLPDWRPIQITTTIAPSHQDGDRKIHRIDRPRRPYDDASGSQALAE